MSKSRQLADKKFAQSWFDLRDIVLPKPSKGKGQRFRSDVRNILFTIGSQGDRAEGDGNVSKWAEATIIHRTGISRDNWREYRDWLIGQGLLKHEARPGIVVFYWLDHKALRRIVAAQQAEKDAWDASELEKKQANIDYEIQPWLPVVGFTEWEAYKAVDVEALSRSTSQKPVVEPRAEAREEARAEAHTEAHVEPRVEHVDSMSEHEQDWNSFQSFRNVV